MKTCLIAVAAPFVLLAHSPAFADTQDCATRIRALETQIDQAKRFGNTQQLMRQQIALAQVQEICTDAGQLSRAERNVQDKQSDVERNVQDKQRDVEQARGDVRKVEKARRKLAGKQDKLREATRDLHEAEGDRIALKG
ncbi:DUF1090 family protein [Burkholderia pyrrocinia]|uniref:DUF1090 family protein n=1 Tax=Burkholderia pyrrocinia TaxID=60550 RepID=UPI001BD01F5B|nr:DUF1090 family protein [Burkholderia pyrrocinia]QVN22195.1 DUF1090 family protein [Burkholderia pyrrocinia]